MNGEYLFVPTSPGTYYFVCSISGHCNTGMKVKVTVTWPSCSSFTCPPNQDKKPGADAIDCTDDGGLCTQVKCCQSRGETTQAPDGGSTTEAPDGGSTTQVPDGGSTTQAPEEEEDPFKGMNSAVRVQLNSWLLLVAV